MIDEIKQLLITELNLEGVEPQDIDENAPLFNDGLGLDSIDALELAVIMDNRYGIKIKAGDDANTETFSTPLALANYIAENRIK